VYCPGWILFWVGVWPPPHEVATSTAVSAAAIPASRANSRSPLTVRFACFLSRITTSAKNTKNIPQAFIKSLAREFFAHGLLFPVVTLPVIVTPTVTVTGTIVVPEAWNETGLTEQFEFAGAPLQAIETFPEKFPAGMNCKL
jgi:hypothetical protein